jgi:menaquinone-dependent protoporphyrinogen IX oxidase
VSDKKRLVVFHSSTGNTHKVAQALAEALSADLEQIREVHPQRVDMQGKGFGNRMVIARAVLTALLGRATAIEPAQHDPAAYDLVVIGGPVYAGALTGPVRAYINQQRARFRAVAFFCTGAEPEKAKVFAQMQQATGKVPLASAAFAAAKIEAGECGPQVQAFISHL